MGVRNNNDTNENKDSKSDFHFLTSKNALIIFVRNPELGKCKTRLAETVGDEAALEVYKHLLQHTAHVAKSIVADRFVFYSEMVQKNDIWDDDIFIKKLQSEGDLGMKMEHAFFEIFQMDYEKIIIIGSDLFELKPQHINEAYQHLNTNEAVIGPAKDGGYYLLGLTSMKEFLFRNKSWSTSKVLEETLNNLKENNIKFTTLELLNDIDTYDDLIASNDNQNDYN